MSITRLIGLALVPALLAFAGCSKENAAVDAGPAAAASPATKLRFQAAFPTSGLMFENAVFFTERVGEMDRFFDELNDLLRTQYLLGYQATPPGFRSEFRTIEVRVKGRNDIVRHRTGYYAEPRQ